jgi:hypothetical protein
LLAGGAEKLDGLIGIALVEGDAFAKGVGVAECEIRMHSLI